MTAQHKHKITFKQAQAAHKRGVEVWTPNSDHIDPGHKWHATIPDGPNWTYALDRTPGRSLTYDEACVHYELKLPIEGRSANGDWFISTGPFKDYSYRVSPAQETAEQEKFQYVTGIRNVPEGEESEWECERITDDWVPRFRWSKYCCDFTERARFRHSIAHQGEVSKFGIPVIHWLLDHPRAAVVEYNSQCKVMFTGSLFVRVDMHGVEQPALLESLVYKTFVMPQGYSEATPVRDSGCVPESQELRKLQESFDAQTTAIDAIDAIRRALNNLDDTAARIYKKYLERQG